MKATVLPPPAGAPIMARGIVLDAPVLTILGLGHQPDTLRSVEACWREPMRCRRRITLDQWSDPREHWGDMYHVREPDQPYDTLVLVWFRRPHRDRENGACP